jgi:hypothetical protein
MKEAPGTAPHPVLARLDARLRRQRRERIRAVGARAFLEALCLQLTVLPLAGILAAFHPYDPLGLQLALATYGFCFWPLLRLALARRRGLFRLQAMADLADRLNPEAPDIFRTVLSLRNHSSDTVDALEAFYGPWEPRLRDPRARWSRGCFLPHGFAPASLEPDPRAALAAAPHSRRGFAR